MFCALEAYFLTVNHTLLKEAYFLTVDPLRCIYSLVSVATRLTSLAASFTIYVVV